MVNVPSSAEPITDKVVRPTWYRFFNDLNRAKLEASLVSTFMLTVLDDTSATAALATLGITTGTYTPTLTGVANVAASTAYLCRYVRVSNMVIVAGRADVDPTAAAPTATTLGISLPVASNFADTLACNGVANWMLVNQSGGINGDAANDRAEMTYMAISTANAACWFVFMYQVI